MSERGRRARLIPDLSIATALFLGNLLVLGPFLLTGFTDQPWNNGYGYMAIARQFHDRPWTWNSLEYCGAPFHYLYPPLFHVLLGWMPAASLGRAFHLLTGIAYALVPVCLYVLGRQLFGSKLVAALAAVLYSAFPSPLYYLLPGWKSLSLAYSGAPWGFVALVGYEEAAHLFALPFTLLAVAAAWRGRWLLASLAAAVVLLTNWPALIGLGFPIAAVALARTRDAGFLKSASQVGGAVGAAYGLAAFWMTPGYFVSSTLLNRIVLRHSPVEAAPWSGTTWLILLAAACLIALSLWRRVPSTAALLIAWIALSGAVLVSYTFLGNALVPSPNRYALEFNLALTLGLAYLVSLAAPRWRAVLAAGILVAGAAPAFGFLSHAWAVQPHSQDPRVGVAYQIAAWLNQHAGASRVFVSGEMEATLPLWSNLPQVGGTSQDISNFLVFAAARQVALDCGPGAQTAALLWLRALNVRYVVVHRAASRECYHWYADPDRFEVLPVVWDDRAGDVIYRVPDSGESDAVVVDLPALDRLPRLRSTADPRFLQSYAAWAAGKRPASIRWSAADSAAIDATPGPGEAILVKTNFNSGWRVSNGAPEPDPIGFLLIRSQPGRQRLTLRFGASWDVWLGRAITFMAVVLLLARIPRIWIAAAAVVPAVAAYAVLLSSAPPHAVAENAFLRIRPPIVYPRGIVDGLTYRQPPFDRESVLSAFGWNLGAKGDAVRVWVGGLPAEVLYQSPTHLNFKPPAAAPPESEIRVEVNGCRGNAFLVAVR